MNSGEQRNDGKMLLNDMPKTLVVRRGSSKWHVCAIAFLLLSVPAFGQAWSGVLTTARAADWTQAGVPGGIPSGTWSNCVTAACNTAFASPTTANVNAACATAPNNTVVRIPAGTFSWAAGVHCNHGNVVLRGAGPRSTFITGTILMGAQGISGQGSYPTGLGSTNLSGTLTQGSTVLTVASTTGLSAGQTVVIDQHNAAYVNTTGVEGPCFPGNSCGRNDSPIGFSGASSRAQQEMALITNVNSGASQITIAAPGLGHDYTLGLAPQVFFWNTPINPQYAGVENMNVNANNIDRAVSLPFCDYCWVKNVEIDNTARAGVFFFWGYRDEVRDSYITGSNGTGASTHYGVELLETTLAKGENNILFGVVSPWITEGSYGTVVAYNYMLRTAADNQYASIETHLSHSWKQLREGNSGSTSQYDDSWGSASHMTDFRNYMNGKEPNATNYRSAVSIQALNEYDNLVGNVLGDPTYHTNYQCINTNVLGSDNYIYDLGFFNGCVNGSLTSYDTLTLTSLMRWSNWDAATYVANGNTNGIRSCTGAGAGNPACTASETASADPTFPGLASPSTTLPASFYTGSTAHAACGTGLSFWKNPSSGACPAYPPIGPDVACTTNCVSNTATHAAKIPAQLCYENGAKDAGGYLTAFDGATCYSPDTGPIAPDDILAGPNPGWSFCGLPGCDPGGTGVPVNPVQTINNASPSLDGASMQFGMTSAAGGNTNALWVYKYAANDAANLFATDFWVYPAANCGVVQQFEFDTWQSSVTDNTEYMFGMQCNRTDGKWDIWNQLSGQWIPSAAPCQLTCASWNHIQQTFHRVVGDTNQCSGKPCMYFDTLTVNGLKYDIYVAKPAGTKPASWGSNIGIQWQLNIPGASTTSTENLDSVLFSATTGTPTQTIYRPTVFVDTGAYPITNPANVYDGDSSTVATGVSNMPVNTISTFDVVYKGFPAVTGTPPAVLYVRSDTYYPGGCSPQGGVSITYSLDNGVTENTLWVGDSHGAQNAPITDRVVLPFGQDLTKVQVHWFSGGFCSSGPAFFTSQNYEVWIQTVEAKSQLQGTFQGTVQ